ncbi:hypothetical protein ACFQDD_01955 [Halorubrum pallidum]|uniref:Uncharacterized protein n=1 Tax=Halorubrum pallidum TaxID=1526114 RepID=A0ABD5SYZ2_9EURY
MEPTTTTPSPVTDGEAKEYAEEYHEAIEEIGVEKVTVDRLRRKTTDITYWTGQGTTRTVRIYGATESSSYNSFPEGFYGFYHNGKKYAYSPEQDKLISIPSRDKTITVADSEAIIRYEEVNFPERAVVDGAVQKGVEATVYYRTPRSDSIQSVTMRVKHVEGRYPAQISGPEVDGDRRIEASIKHDRTIQTTVPDMTLGRVARVEFPKGHQFSLAIEGIEDDRVTDARIESVEQKIKSAFRGKADDVTLSHEGHIER